MRTRRAHDLGNIQSERVFLRANTDILKLNLLAAEMYFFKHNIFNFNYSVIVKSPSDAHQQKGMDNFKVIAEI